MRNSAIALMVATLALAACGTKNVTTTVTGNGMMAANDMMATNDMMADNGMMAANGAMADTGMMAHNDMAMNSMGSNEMKADKKTH